jgi:flagellar basal-body rod modification protein FlgD
MSITGVSQVPSNGGQTNALTNNQVMGKSDFLNLLVAQLQAQDPLNPMDSTAFTAQLAQFSSLEQLQNINTTLGTMNTTQSALGNSQAVEYIGKNVKAVGNTAQLADGQSQPVQFSLDKDAAALYVKIYDQQGNYINQIESGPLAAGQQQLTWNGRDYLGNQAPDGTYTYEVDAIDQSGNSVSATTYTSGKVTGVDFKDGQAYLQCGTQEILLGNVTQVSAEE